MHIDPKTSATYFSSLIRELNHRTATTALSHVRPRNEALLRYLLRTFRDPAGTHGAFVAEPVFEAMFGWKEADVSMGDLARRGALHPRLVDVMDRPVATIADRGRRKREDRAAPEESLEQSRFAKTWRPRMHQLTSWEHLGQDGHARSLVVCSGTGSGKTECFMVPMLDDLARLHEEQGAGPLRGVRALLLYPLNALIASQRDRLRAWTAGFNGDLRYALFNSKLPNVTPEAAREDVRAEEVPDRVSLRADPPPVLVTNPSMLEYMLLRAEDEPILEASRGELRWIVLDEAHTYQGSAATEMAMLIRRVLEAFDVGLEDVRFVATSATIGGSGDEAYARLRHFLHQLTGAPEEHILVVDGERHVPPLPDAPLAERPRPAHELVTATDEERLQWALSHPGVRRLRETMATVDRALSLRQVSAVLAGHPHDAIDVNDWSRDDYDEALTTLDVVRAIPLPDPDSDDDRTTHLLPVRGHVFVRTQPGLWTCVNPCCSGLQQQPELLESSALAGNAGTDGDGDATPPGWPWGAVSLTLRDSCPHCAWPVREIVLCPACGDESLRVALATIPGDDPDALAAEWQLALTAGALSETADTADGDDAEGAEGADPDADGDAEAHGVDPSPAGTTAGTTLPGAVRSATPSATTTALLRPPPAGGGAPAQAGSTLWLGQAAHARGAWRLYDDRGPAAHQRLPLHVERVTNATGKPGPTTCPCCERSTRADRLRRFAAGSRLLLPVTSQTLLEHAPPRRETDALPMQGRNLITFTDSRAETARFALEFGTTSERRAAQGILWSELAHALRKQPEVSAPDPEQQRLRNHLSTLEGLPASVQKDIAEQIVHARRELAELEAALRDRPAPAPVLGFERLVDLLRKTAPIKVMARDLGGLLDGESDGLRERQAAQLAVLREFGRLHERHVTLETTGLIEVVWPEIEGNSDALHVPPDLIDLLGRSPDPTLHASSPAEVWCSILVWAMQRIVRREPAVALDRQFRQAMGTTIPNIWFVKPEGPQPDKLAQRKGARSWPTAAHAVGGSWRVAGASLAAFLRVPLADKANQAVIDGLLRSAFAALTKVRALDDGATEGQFRFDPAKGLHVRPARRAWVCPITRRLTHHAVLGVSPWVHDVNLETGLDPLALAARWKLEEVTIPWPPALTADREEWRAHVVDWLQTDEQVRELRERGLWHAANDRVVEHLGMATIAEHSAQVEREELEEHEAAFRKGELNVLSCSTTMEMGVDIGSLGVVAMNNPPPSPANYLQRAGRAGRRDDSEAVALTLCGPDALGAAVFRNPRWPFDTRVHVPDVRLHAHTLLQRHVNAWLLGRFLKEHKANSLALKAHAFLEQHVDAAAPCPAHLLVTRLGSGAWPHEAELTRLRTILHGTGLHDEPTEHLLGRTADALQRIREGWQHELDLLVEQILPLCNSVPELKGRYDAGRVDDLIGKHRKRRRGDGDDPGILTDAQRLENDTRAALLSLHLQIKRHREMYLLEYLAEHQFLPGHGFPTGIVPFVTTTAADLRARGEDKRRDRATKPATFPTRPLDQAIREYAPGMTITLNKRIHRSAGVTLNWKIPVGETHEETVREIQSIRPVRYCPACDSWEPLPADAAPGTGDEVCAVCGERARFLRLLRPAGFAVDLRDEPSNNTDDAGTGGHISRHVRLDRDNALAPLDEDGVPTPPSQWRWAGTGQLLEQRTAESAIQRFMNAGPGGCGYAVCLHCGRAAAHSADAPTELPEGMRKHRPLRARGLENGLCKGAATAHGAARGVTLGGESRTHAWELRLRSVNGMPLAEGVLRTIGEAMRMALARTLGVGERELATDINKGTRGNPGDMSLIIHDVARGGGGYAVQGPAMLRAVLDETRAILCCTDNDPSSSEQGCDACCTNCILTFDTRRHAVIMNRHAALDVLDDTWVAQVTTPTTTALAHDT